MQAAQKLCMQCDKNVSAWQLYCKQQKFLGLLSSSGIWEKALQFFPWLYGFLTLQNSYECFNESFVLLMWIILKTIISILESDKSSHITDTCVCRFHTFLPVVDPGGFQGLHGNPLLKFIYSNKAVRLRLSNKAVRLRCSNYSSFIRNYPVIQENCWEKSIKVDDLFFYWSSTQTGLVFCQAETLFQKS